MDPARGARTHILLDLDGTLSDSEPGILNSLQWACMIEGFPIPTEEEVRSVIGPPFELGLPSIGIPDDALERVIDRYRERYADTGAYENTLYDGIVEMLDTLATAGYSLSIATAKPEVTAYPILDYFGLSQRFEWSARQKRRMLIVMHTTASALITRPIHGPTPLAMPISGSTNGNTMYIRRQRTVATASDVWNALRA